MKVTIVSRIYSPEPSAASYALGAIASALFAAGHTVEVITVNPPRGLVANDKRGIRVRRWPALRDKSGYVRGYVQYLSFDLPLALRLLFARRADLYIVEPPPTTGAVVRVVCALLRRPYLYDAADIWSDAAQLATRSRLVIRLLRWVELFAVKGAAGLFTISQGVIDRFRELGADRPAVVTGFGVDATVFGYTVPTESTSPYFVYAGTFSEWHGAHVLIEGFARFARNRPDYRLLFVGNGSEGQSLEALAIRLGIGDRVEFRQPVSPIELRPILANATAALASLKPNAGYDYAFTSKVYSSMAVGCPSVFTGPGPTIDFLNEAEQSQRSGLAVDFEADAVAQALAHFADHPLDSAERQRLSAWTRANYSLGSVASKIVRLAEDTVARRRA